MWLARLTENGLLRPSFVPPAPIRVLRHYTRARTRLTQDRTRCWQRLEKLLEDSLIKVSSVASKLTTASARDMIEALRRLRLRVGMQALIAPVEQPGEILEQITRRLVRKAERCD